MRLITAEAIRQFRTSVNLTQAELGAKLCYSPRSIARMEAPGNVLAAHVQDHITRYAKECGRVPQVNGDLVVGYSKPPAAQ